MKLTFPHKQKVTLKVTNIVTLDEPKIIHLIDIVMGFA